MTGVQPCGLPIYLRPKILGMSKIIIPRWPNWSVIFNNNNAIMAQERLAIVDAASGKQPLYSPCGKFVLAANGEIYNHNELREKLTSKYEFQTQSDCEIILALYKERGADFVDNLNGIFGFAIYDIEQDSYFIARDHMGIIPLYIGWDKNGTFYVASELKALESTCNKIQLFPPGHYFCSKKNEFIKWYNRDWTDFESVKENETSIKQIKEALESAVHRQLMSDVPYGVLLSGGLDSSVTSAIAKKYSQKRIESGDTTYALWPHLHSFSVGLYCSPVFSAATNLAAHIVTIPHSITFPFLDVLDAI